MAEIAVRTIDSLALPRVDLIKIDVEGMEMAVLHGAVNTIREQRPVMFVEHIKLDKGAFERFLRTLDYTLIHIGMNSIAFHRDDRISAYL